MKQAVKYLKIAGNVLIWLFVAFSIVVTLLVFAAQGSSDGLPRLFGKTLVTVQSNSMDAEGGFKEGDMIVIKFVPAQDLKKDDVITFDLTLTGANGEKIETYNTHRIISDPVINSEGVYEFETQGDNREISQVPETVTQYEYKGVWTGAKIGGVGNFIDFLKTSTGFLVCIVLPLVAFFIFELVNFILVLSSMKKPKLSALDEEELKRKAIEEYLKEQSAKQDLGVNEDTDKKE